MIRIFARAATAVLTIVFLVALPAQAQRVSAAFLSAGTVAHTTQSMAFHHAVDLGVSSTSPLSTSFTPAANSNLLEVCVEFTPGASPTVTAGGVPMILPANSVATSGGNNQLAMYYLFNPPTTAGNIVITRGGASWLNAVAADYSVPAGVFDGAATSTQGAPADTYSASVTVPTANDWVISCSNNVGSATVDSVAAPNILRVKSSPNQQSVLADSGTGVGAGAYNISVTIGSNNGGGAVDQTRVSHFIPGGPPVPPTVAAVCLGGVCTGPYSFQTPASGTLFTLSASCSAGPCAGATFSLPSVATSGCTTGQIAQNANFTVSGSNLNAVGTISGTPTENLGIVVNLTGATNDGQCFPVVLNGSAPFISSLACNPSPVILVDTSALHTVGCTLAPTVSSGSFTGTYSVVSCDISPCPLGLSQTTPGATVWTVVSPPMADSSGNIVIRGTQAGTKDVTVPFTISPPSNVTLDNTIFTGSQINTPNGGDVIIANVTGCSGPGDCVVGGADGSKFKIVGAGGTGAGGWTNSANGGPRRGPFLMSNGSQAGCTTGSGGCHITLNGAPFTITSPPAPSTSGAVVVTNGGNIQNAINSAGGGVPIFVNCGNYSGGFSTNGHNVVSATRQNHINGQTCRADINLGGGTITANGTDQVYGFGMTNGGGGTMQGSGTFNNVTVDQQFSGNQAYCNSPGMTIMWSSISNFNGGNNVCGAGTPFTMDRNYIHHCTNDCDGGDYTGSGNFVYTNNFCDVDNTTNRHMGNLGACIEYGVHPGVTTILENNYTLNAGADSTQAECNDPNSGFGCGGYGFSLIGETTTAMGQVFRFNYIAGHNTFTEVSTHIGFQPASRATVTDNYLDWQNIQNFGVFSIIGNGSNPAQGIGDTGSPCPEGNSITAARNNEIPVLADFCLGNYTPGDTVNRGIPAPFAAGADQ